MATLKKIFFQTRHILLYGALMAIMILILKWLQWKYLITDYSLDLYVGLIAVFFTILGVWVATQLAKTRIKTVIVEKVVYPPQADDFFHQ